MDSKQTSSPTRNPENPPVDSLGSSDGLIPWADLLDTVFFHRRMIATVCVTGFTLALLWAWITPPVFRAQAMILVKANRSEMAFSPDARAKSVTVGSEALEEINSLSALIRSPVLIEEVLNSMPPGTGSAEEPSFIEQLQDSINSLRWRIQGLPSKAYRWAHGLPAPTALDHKIREILNYLEFTPVPESNLVVIAFTSRSPGWAKKLVNALVENLISKYTQLHQHTGARRFYEDQRILLSERLEDAQSQLTDFRETVGGDLLSIEVGEIQERIAALEDLLLSTHTRRAELESLANAPEDTIVADSASQDLESGTLGNPAIHALKARIVELEIQRSELLSRYTDSSIAVKDLNRQIVEANRLLEKERRNSITMHRRNARAKIDVVEAKLSAMQEQRQNHRDTLSKLEDVLPQFSRLQNNVRTQHEAYVTYLRKEEEARLSNALDDSQFVNISIAERAQLPAGPAQAGKKKRVVFGAAFSMILALGIALFKDFTDQSVKTAGQAERIAGLPVLGQIQG